MTNPPVRKPGEEAPPPPAGLAKPPATRAAQLIDAVDWAIAENGRAGGPYAGKLDTTKIAVMGQSCGGVQAIQASADPHTTLTVAWNSGLLPTPSPGMEMISKDALKHRHIFNAVEIVGRVRKSANSASWRWRICSGGCAATKRPAKCFWVRTAACAPIPPGTSLRRRSTTA